VALIHYRLGVSYAQANQPAEAMPYLEEALALQEAVVDDDRQNRALRSDVASTQHFIAVSLNKLNRPLDALAHLDAAIAVRESMLAEDGRDARTRSLLAGNYAEQSTALLRLGRLQPALDAVQRALKLQGEVLALDPQGVPNRFSAADFHARAGAVYISMAERKSSAQNLQLARGMYERATSFYDQLQAEGQLRSTVLIEDANSARRELARLTATR
jgi:tetratricopeptide (TPR) repeat protein